MRKNPIISGNIFWTQMELIIRTAQCIGQDMQWWTRKGKQEDSSHVCCRFYVALYFTSFNVA